MVASGLHSAVSLPTHPPAPCGLGPKLDLGPALEVAPGHRAGLASRLHSCTGPIQCPHVLVLQHDEKMNLAHLSALRCCHFFFLRQETKRRDLLPLTQEWTDVLPIMMLESSHCCLPHLSLPCHECPSSDVINLQLINIRQRNKDAINFGKN